MKRCMVKVIVGVGGEGRGRVGGKGGGGDKGGEMTQALYAQMNNKI
jgi:hypothetical protein